MDKSILRGRKNFSKPLAPLKLRYLHGFSNDNWAGNYLIAIILVKLASRHGVARFAQGARWGT
jgi:hypothetical protein